MVGAEVAHRWPRVVAAVEASLRVVEAERDLWVEAEVVMIVVRTAPEEAGMAQ